MTASEIVKLAEKEVGYIGKKSPEHLYDKKANIVGKYTKYAADLSKAGYYNGNKNGFDWCCVFVDWLFWKVAGEDKEAACEVKPTGIYGAGVTGAYNEYKLHNRISPVPMAGFQIFFQDATNELSHTGIVKSYNEATGIVTTIEGNWENKVQEREYSVHDERIYAYGQPFYDEPASPFHKGDKVKLTSNKTANGVELASWVTDGRPLWVLWSDVEKTGVTVNENLQGLTAVMNTADVDFYEEPTNPNHWEKIAELIEQMQVVLGAIEEEVRQMSNE